MWVAIYFYNLKYHIYKKIRAIFIALICRDTRIRTWDPLLPKQVR